MNAATTDRDAWDRYWDYGNLHSFSQVTGGNYGGPIAAFWHGRFATLSEGARVVDIATGNGAVALLALASAEERACEIHGTDLAAIDPVNRIADQALRERARAIRFHPRTPAEALPFEPATIDLACSQFGLEYSDLQRSVPEAARVLRAGGTLALVLHHTDSAVVRSAREEAAGLDYVLDEARVYLKTRNFLRALADARVAPGTRPPPKAAKKRRAVDQAIESVRSTAAARTNPRTLLGPLNYVQEVLSMSERAGAGEALRWLEEARQRVTSMRQRLADMQAAARSPDDIAALEQALEDGGFTDIRHGILTDPREGILGWWLEARRDTD